MVSKCKGGIVWPLPNTVPPWQQIVSFDPNPHRYNTLNLPTWDPADYPFLLTTKATKDCDLVSRPGDHASCYDVNAIEVVDFDIGKKAFAYGWQLKHDDHYSFYGEKSYVYYANNAFHWDNNGQGALNLYWDKLEAADIGFQVGRSLYPSSNHDDGEIKEPARYMDNVYGIQFEWDSGRPFGATGHPHDTTSTKSDGFQLQDLVLFYTMLDQNGKAMQEFCLVLVKNKDLQPGICYWYEGYSLLNGGENWQSGGQGSESTQPRRTGKCGFAIDCARNSGFQFLRECTANYIDGTKFIFNNNWTDVGRPQDATRVGTRLIWTSMFVGFHSRKDGTNKRKNFRMWNAKPITVPVTYKDQDNRHDPDQYWPDRVYKVWEHTDVQVVAAPELSSATSRSERVLPGIMTHKDDAANSFLSNGQSNKEFGVAGSEDSSMPLMNDTVGGPIDIDKGPSANGHLGMPPSDGSAGNVVGS